MLNQIFWVICNPWDSSKEYPRFYIPNLSILKPTKIEFLENNPKYFFKN